MVIFTAGVCWLLSLYFNIKSMEPTIEADGKYWVIRVNAKYFVNYYILSQFDPCLKLVLFSGTDPYYEDCQFPSREEAEVYFEHVCNYAAEGRYKYG